jgi:hypothetical protein
MKTADRVQECLDNETYCAERAASALDADAKITFVEWPGAGKNSLVLGRAFRFAAP